MHVPQFRTIFSFCSIIILLYACKKNETSRVPVTPPVVIDTIPVVTDTIAATCRIDTLAAENGLAFNLSTITYNASGKLSKVAVSSLAVSFARYYTYNESFIYIYTDMGMNSYTDTVTLNSMGLVSNVKQQQSGYGVIRVSYTYDADSLLTSSVIQQEGISPTTTTYTYINGDLTYRQDSGVRPDTLSYYTDKLTSIGDLNNFNQLYSWGAYYDKSKHLLKSEKSGNYINNNYSYTFDTDGKITSNIIDNGSHIVTTNIKYHCP